MSFQRRLQERGEFLIRLIFALFLFVACASHGKETAGNTIQEEYRAAGQRLKHIVQSKRQQTQQLTEQKGASKHHPIEKALRKTTTFLFRALLFPLTIAQRVTDRHAPNGGNTDMSANSVALELHEAQAKAELNQIKSALASYIPKKNLDDAIANPDKPARALISIENRQRHLKQISSQKQKYATELEKIQPSDRPNRRFIACTTAGIAGGALAWLAYNKFKHTLISPEAKKRALENQLRNSSKQIKALSLEIDTLENKNTEKDSNKGPSEPNESQNIQATISKLKEEKTTLVATQGEILRNLANRTYAKPGLLHTLAHTTSTALGSSLGFFLTKKYMAYQPKKLSFHEQQRYNVLEARSKNIASEEEQEKTYIDESIKNYQSTYGPLSKEVIAGLMQAREKERELKKTRAHKMLGRIPVFGTFMRLIVPIIQNITGNLIQVDI